MHAFEGNTFKEKGAVKLADRHNECCNTEVLYWSCTQPLKITEIHRKPVFNKPWFQVLNNCKTLQLMKQVVRIESGVLRKPNSLLLQNCACLVEEITSINL